MAITASQIIEDRAQVDGRRYVTELHTDHIGKQHRFTFLVPAAFDASAAMSARAVALVAHLADQELALNESRALAEGLVFTPPTFVYCTAAQARARVREIYATAASFVVCRLAWYIQRLTLSDNQLKAMFSVNDAQLPAVKTKLSNLEAKYIDVVAQVGA